MKTTIINESPWIVDAGFNLYIDISSACNASCPFCIAPSIGRRDGPGFFPGLNFALDLTERIGGTIQVVGGEPLISKRLPDLLDEVHKRNYHRVVVNTNGSFITDQIVGKMRSCGVTHINMSRHHYDEGLNQEIMVIRPALSNRDIVESAERIRSYGIPLRLQCNLISGYIDSVDQMIKYMDWCSSIGICEVSFSQIFPLSLFDYQVPPEPGYTESVQVNLRNIVSEIDQCGLFYLEAELFGIKGTVWGSNWGTSAKRRFWSYRNGLRFSLKTLSGYDADGLPSETRYSKSNDNELRDGVLSFAVLQSDGRVTASWDRRERVLFYPDMLQDSIIDKSWQPIMAYS